MDQGTEGPSQHGSPGRAGTRLRLRPGRVALEAGACTVVLAAGLYALTDSLGRGWLAVTALTAVTVSLAVATLWVFARPTFDDDAVRMSVGPLRRTYPAARFAKVVLIGPRAHPRAPVLLVRADESLTTVCYARRFTDADAVRDRFARWGRQAGLEIVEE